MKLDTFRLLRIPAQRDSPFCYEVLVAQQRRAAPEIGNERGASVPSFSAPAAAASPPAAAQEAAAARTLFMTHAPVTLSLKRLQQFLEDLAGGYAVEATQEKVVCRLLPRAARPLLPDTSVKSSLCRRPAAAASAAGGATIVRLLFFVFDSADAVTAILASARRVAADAARGHAPAAATAVVAATGTAAVGSPPLRRGPCPFVPLRVTRLQQWIGEAAALVETPAALQHEVDRFMAEYDLRKQLERQQLKQRQQTDEEGFTLVTSAGATAADGTVFRSVRRRETSSPAAAAAAASLRSAGAASAAGEKPGNLFFQQQTTAGRYVPGTGFMSEAVQRKKKRRGGVEEDFYRFQRREKKRREFAERLQSFSEEEKVVAAMEKAGKLSEF